MSGMISGVAPGSGVSALEIASQTWAGRRTTAPGMTMRHTVNVPLSTDAYEALSRLARSRNSTVAGIVARFVDDALDGQLASRPKRRSAKARVVKRAQGRLGI